VRVVPIESREGKLGKATCVLWSGGLSGNEWVKGMVMLRSYGTGRRVDGWRW